MAKRFQIFAKVAILCAKSGHTDYLPFFIVNSYFRGLPRDRCLLFMNSASSTIQKEPKSSSQRTKHLCSDRFVRMAFCTFGVVWWGGGSRLSEQGVRGIEIGQIKVGCECKVRRVLGSQLLKVGYVLDSVEQFGRRSLSLWLNVKNGMVGGVKDVAIGSTRNTGSMKR